MPVDDYGFRADLVVCPASIQKRMIGGPAYECGINRGSEFVRRRCKTLAETGNYEQAYALLLDWYNDINPNYAKLMKTLKTTPEKRKEHVDISIRDGVDVWIPGFLNHIDLKWVLALKRKWNIDGSPVTFKIDDPVTGGQLTFRTEKPVYIGDQNVMLLCKVPKGTSSGIAHISHQGTPIKPTSRDARYQTPLNEKPVKKGEDENRISIGMVPVEIVLRHNALHANSPVRGVNALTEALMLADKPTALEAVDVPTEVLKKTDAILATYHHATGVIGVDTYDTVTTEAAPEGITNDGDILALDHVVSSDYGDNDRKVSDMDAKAGSIFASDGSGDDDDVVEEEGDDS